MSNWGRQSFNWAKRLTIGWISEGFWYKRAEWLNRIERNGKNKTHRSDSTFINQPQSCNETCFQVAKKEVRTEGSSQNSTQCQNNSSIPPGNSRATRNPQVSKDNGSSDQETPLPTLGERDRTRVQSRNTIPKCSGACSPGSSRGVFGITFWRHKFMRDPRKASDGDGEGHAAGPAYQREPFLQFFETLNK